MKKTVFVIFLMMATITGFAQPTNPAASSTENQYLKQADGLRRAGWILLGSGGGLFLLSGAISSTSGSDLMYVCALAGVGCIVLSPLFFISAAQKRKEAARIMQAAFKTETTPVVVKTGFKKISYPAFTVTIKF